MINTTLSEVFAKAKSRYQPYINIVNQIFTLEELSSDEIIKEFKEKEIKSLYFSQDELKLDKEFGNFVNQLTSEGIREIFVFCDKEKSNLTSNNFNNFVHENNIRINLKIAPLSNYDREQLSNDRFAKNDILAIFRIRDFKLIYKDGHEIDLLNNDETDQIILDNHSEHQIQIAKKFSFTLNEPEYITSNNDESMEKRIKDPSLAKRNIEVSVETHITTELNLQTEMDIDIEQENELDLDKDQLDNKYDQEQASKIANRLSKTFFYEEWINSNYLSNKDNPIYNIFNSDTKIKFISRRALDLVVKNIDLFGAGIDTDNLPLGFGLKNGILFASNQRLASMEVNDLTIKLDPIKPSIINPLAYSWLKFASKASISLNSLYGTNLAPKMNALEIHPCIAKTLDSWDSCFGSEQDQMLDLPNNLAFSTYYISMNSQQEEYPTYNPSGNYSLLVLYDKQKSYFFRPYENYNLEFKPNLDNYNYKLLMFDKDEPGEKDELRFFLNNDKLIFGKGNYSAELPSIEKNPDGLSIKLYNKIKNDILRFKAEYMFDDYNYHQLYLPKKNSNYISNSFYQISSEPFSPYCKGVYVKDESSFSLHSSSIYKYASYNQTSGYVEYYKIYCFPSDFLEANLTYSLIMFDSDDINNENQIRFFLSEGILKFGFQQNSYNFPTQYNQVFRKLQQKITSDIRKYKQDYMFHDDESGSYYINYKINQSEYINSSDENSYSSYSINPIQHNFSDIFTNNIHKLLMFDKDDTSNTSIVRFYMGTEDLMYGIGNSSYTFKSLISNNSTLFRESYYQIKNDLLRFKAEYMFDDYPNMYSKYYELNVKDKIIPEQDYFEYYNYYANYRYYSGLSDENSQEIFDSPIINSHASLLKDKTIYITKTYEHHDEYNYSYINLEGNLVNRTYKGYLNKENTSMNSYPNLYLRTEIMSYEKLPFTEVAFSTVSSDIMTKLSALENNLIRINLTQEFNLFFLDNKYDGDFLLEDKTLLFFEKLFIEILPKSDLSKNIFFKYVMKDDTNWDSIEKKYFETILYHEPIELIRAISEPMEIINFSLFNQTPEIEAIITRFTNVTGSIEPVGIALNVNSSNFNYID